MHQFLSSIGFSNIKAKADLDIIIRDIIEQPDNRIEFEQEDGSFFTELSKEFGTSIGIAVRGEYSQDSAFEMEYYFPYFCGRSITTQESVDIEKHSDRESYAGVCDEVKIGVTLIFYLQNVIEYMNLKRTKRIDLSRVTSYLSGLASKGTVLFPVSKDEKQVQNNIKMTSDRNQMIAAARDGDEEAIESLTLEDIDTYSMLSRRVLHEDLFTIVDTYFMPYGIESDQYSILGEIMDFEITKNTLTGEEVYIMTLSCNNLLFDVCINKEQLMGMPTVGRRFKGNIWMQGVIDYPNM